MLSHQLTVWRHLYLALHLMHSVWKACRKHSKVYCISYKKYGIYRILSTGKEYMALLLYVFLFRCPTNLEQKVFIVWFRKPFVFLNAHSHWMSLYPKRVIFVHCMFLDNWNWLFYLSKYTVIINKYTLYLCQMFRYQYACFAHSSFLHKYVYVTILCLSLQLWMLCFVTLRLI